MVDQSTIWRKALIAYSVTAFLAPNSAAFASSGTPNNAPVPIGGSTPNPGSYSPPSPPDYSNDIGNIVKLGEGLGALPDSIPGYSSYLEKGADTGTSLANKNNDQQRNAINSAPAFSTNQRDALDQMEKATNANMANSPSLRGN